LQTVGFFVENIKSAIVKNSQWDRRLGIVDKYNEKKIYFDDYYGRFFTGGFLNQIAMGFVGIPFPR